MTFEYNKIPALSIDFLETVEKIKNDIRYLKETAYGPDCNYYDGTHFYEPKLISRHELDSKLSNILSSETLKKLSLEQKKIRSKIDYNLVKTVVEQILPIWMGPDTLVEYDFYLVGRDMSQIDSKTDPRRGRKDRQVPILVLPAKEWKDAWKEYILLDERMDKGNMREFIPEGTNLIISTVHRFYAVKKNDKNYRRNCKNTNGFIEGYEIVDEKNQVDCRTKSGSEFLWKLCPLLTGLEDKPGKTREEIVDVAGVRLITRTDFEEKSVDLFYNFMINYTGDCMKSLKLQVLDSDTDKQKSEFINSIQSRKLRNFCEKILDTEDRSHYLSHEDVTKLAKKYYLEMLIPFSLCVGEDDEKLFGKNPINILSYHQGTFKKIHEKHDDFIYKGRRDDWRDEHYSYLEWRVIELMSELLSGDSLKYMRDIVKSKINKRKEWIKHLFHRSLF